MLLSGVVAGLALGFAFGRDWRRLASLRIAWFPLLVTALVVRAAAPFAPVASLALFVAAIGLTGLVAAVNWRLPGAVFVALGSALNVLVILANGAMPVDQAALEAAGGQLPRDALHEPLTPASALAPLADIFVLGPLRAAYSIGDFAIAVGGFLLPFVTLTRR